MLDYDGHGTGEHGPTGIGLAAARNGMSKCASHKDLASGPSSAVLNGGLIEADDFSHRGAKRDGVFRVERRPPLTADNPAPIAWMDKDTACTTPTTALVTDSICLAWRRSPTIRSITGWACASESSFEGAKSMISLR